MQIIIIAIGVALGLAMYNSPGAIGRFVGGFLLVIAIFVAIGFFGIMLDH